MSVVRIKLSRESLALIREVLESELAQLNYDGDCEKDIMYCIGLIDALDELPIVK